MICTGFTFRLVFVCVSVCLFACLSCFVWFPCCVLIEPGHFLRPHAPLTMPVLFLFCSHFILFTQSCLMQTCARRGSLLRGKKVLPSVHLVQDVGQPEVPHWPRPQRGYNSFVWTWPT